MADPLFSRVSASVAISCGRDRAAASTSCAGSTASTASNLATQNGGNSSMAVRLPKIIELDFEKGGPPGFHRSAGYAEICTKPPAAIQCRKPGKPRSPLMSPAAKLRCRGCGSLVDAGGPSDYPLGTPSGPLP